MLTGCRNGMRKEDGSFAKYMAVKGDLQIPIPDSISDEEAATLGISITTVVSPTKEIKTKNKIPENTTNTSSTQTGPGPLPDPQAPPPHPPHDGKDPHPHLRRLHRHGHLRHPVRQALRPHRPGHRLAPQPRVPKVARRRPRLRLQLALRRRRNPLRGGQRAAPRVGLPLLR